MLKRLFSWKTLRRLLIAGACLVTLVALIVTVENIRAKRAWQKCAAELTAKGEKLEWKQFIPPAVPDDQNLAMTPTFRELRYLNTNPPTRGENVYGDPQKHPLIAIGIDCSSGDKRNPPQIASVSRDIITDLTKWQEFYRGNTNYPQASDQADAAHTVLKALSRFDSELDELKEAAKKPAARYPVHYEENISMLLPHLAVVKGCVKTFTLRAIARLESGDSNGAVEDVTTALRLADSIKQEPVLISHLVALACWSLCAEGVREGIARHAWQDQDLLKLQQLFLKTDALASYEECIRGERAFSLEAIELMRTGRINASQVLDNTGTISLGARFVPSAFYYQNARTIAQWHQELILPWCNATNHRVYPESAETADQKFATTPQTPYNIFAKMLFPAVVKSIRRTGETQAIIDEAAISCALERCFLATHQYPETFSELTPRFATRLPTDPVNGEPYKYNRTPNGFYTLYSVGWDLKDDGGKISPKKKNREETKPENSDWVWQYPSAH